MGVGLVGAEADSFVTAPVRRSGRAYVVVVVESRSEGWLTVLGGDDMVAEMVWTGVGQRV